METQKTNQISKFCWETGISIYEDRTINWPAKGAKTIAETKQFIAQLEQAIKYAEETQ